MLIPVLIGNRGLSDDEIREDKLSRVKLARCAVGKRALYVKGRFLDRFYYIPWFAVERVFKRVAMSGGGFSGKGAFGAVSYLVIQYDGGREKEVYIKRENDVDRILAQIQQSHPDIPTMSAVAERKLKDAEKKEAERYLKDLGTDASAAVSELRKAKDYLELRPTVCEDLVNAAKQKRIVDGMSPSLRTGGIVAGALSVAAIIYGLYAMLTKGQFGLYFMLGGGAVLFTCLAANILPNKWNSKSYAQREWDAALAASADHVAGRKNFPVAPQYAHPIVLERMIRIIREGRAKSVPAAYELMKSDLKALNSSVKVSQQEYDEVVKIKPLFLVCDYQD